MGTEGLPRLEEAECVSQVITELDRPKKCKQKTSLTGYYIAIAILGAFTHFSDS